jgi:uncharacterized protein (TIGR02266 family)
MPGDDQREHEREPVTLIVDYEGADDLVADVTGNLSAGGTLVHTERDFAVGASIRLSLSFPGLLKPIWLAGVVRWTRRDSEGGSDRPEQSIGIEFVESEATLARVRKLLERIRDRDPALVGRVVRVLVVEDNPHVARLIREGLSGGAERLLGGAVSFELHDASHGREAIDRLASGVFDVLIVDVYLPVLDGPAVIEWVRRQDALRALPILAVSAGGKAAREAAMQAGADSFLEKPMRLQQIVETLQKLIPLG